MIAPNHSLKDVLDELGVPYHSHGEGFPITQGWLGVDCPWCGKGTFGLGLSLDGRAASCWKCGVHKVAEVLVELSGRPFGEVRPLLKELRSDDEYKPKYGRLELPKCVGPLLPVHRKYLRDRGFDPEELQRLWGLQGIGAAPALAWRIFIPVIHHGDVVSWTTRHVRKDHPKRYVTAKPEQERLPAKSVIYGADFARLVIIVGEGPFGSYRVGPGFGATLGVGWTEAQVHALSRYTHRYIAFDNNPEAQARAERLCDELSPYPGRTFRVVIDAPQPDQAGPKEIAALRRLLE